MGQEEERLDQSSSDVVASQPGSEEQLSISQTTAPIGSGSRIGEILFGRYRISEVIREDRSGATYRGRDLSSNTRVLIETTTDPLWWPAGQEKFSQGELTLGHPNILLLLGCEETEEGQRYFFSEYLDFIRLSDLVENSGFIEQESEVFDTLSQVCQALAYAHQCGITHGYLHPRNVFLIEEESFIKVKVGNFGVARPSISKSGAVEDDIMQLSILAYFLLTGQAPHKELSLDEMYESLAEVKPNFGSLVDHRGGDLLGWDELTQLLEDVSDDDDNYRIKTVKEFEDGLSDWIEAVKRDAARQSEMARKVASGELKVDDSTVKKKKKKTTNNMRTTVKQMVNLKANQANQEETAVMKLADLAAARGPRLSPLQSALKIGALAASVLITAGLVTYAFVFRPSETQEAWHVTSRWVAGFFPRSGKDDDDQKMEEMIPEVVPVKKAAATGKNSDATTKVAVDTAAQRPGMNLQPGQKRPNKMPPFNHEILKDLYSASFVSDSNRHDDSKRRRFRIEYREFKEDWLKK